MPGPDPEVLRLADTEIDDLRGLLRRFNLELHLCAPGAAIPGSYWGDDEAGLRGATLYARSDTPLHSILHETSHFICLDPARRARLDTDAGSDDAEENAVCYLQILLADELEDYGRERIMADMDAWGYSFRLGSTRAWFERDAADGLAWLRLQNLVDRRRRPGFQLRERE